jgi:putative ABC transport system ATP-binding protein
MGIRIENLRKNFKQGEAFLEILKGLNLDIKDRELVAIVGQSGSGKSTLLSLLAGLDQADSGKIIIDEQNISELNEEQLTRFRCQKIGIVFQQFHLVNHLTALENVMLPLEITGALTGSLESKEIISRAKDLLSQMGLKDRLDHTPAKLSGGECQRVAIARALIIQPKLLLADEPSGNLDTETGIKVMEILFSVVRQYGITTILVTHSDELASRCDRKLVLKNGVL